VSLTPDSMLADPQQIIANLRRELDECRAERDKAQRNLTETTTERDAALAREAGMAEVLEVINSSPGDLAPVFDAMLEKAMRLCEAAHGHIWRFHGELIHPVAVQGTPRFVEWMRELAPHRPAPGSSLDRLLQGERFVHVADCREMDAYGASLTFRELIDAGGIR
jgi:two-component system NtrC family sensor kinase